MLRFSLSLPRHLAFVSTYSEEDMALDLETKEDSDGSASLQLDISVRLAKSWPRLRSWSVVFGAALALGGSLGLEMTYGLWNKSPQSASYISLIRVTVADYEKQFPEFSRSTLSLLAGIAPTAVSQITRIDVQKSL